MRIIRIHAGSQGIREGMAPIVGLCRGLRFKGGKNAIKLLAEYLAYSGCSTNVRGLLFEVLGFNCVYILCVGLCPSVRACGGRKHQIPRNCSDRRQ